MSLVFVPVNEICPVFEVLNREVRAILPQLVPSGPHMWCVHKQTVRTNNDMEGWHYVMARTIPSRHPDISSFIKWMKDEEIYTKTICSQLDMGQISVKGGNNHFETHWNCHHHRECPLSAFLRDCAYNLAELPHRNGDHSMNKKSWAIANYFVGIH